ncbi:hypothetical protein BWI93_09755 [Siphonobacter sp. BAB-5385]|uniref:site-specific integrase n=1 Tax=Siphonobacter sp. BAB-5385 TaxID=1864822 RepID=UPI000B9ECABB|nr:site-specific integrase [Siphonobacter sp. BAB-5385]OZI08343.1 hypothetical protein BWI93_09755 [Siphonobacter sp. BAB-5385]
MMNRFRILFQLRADSLADKDYAAVNVRVTLNGTRVKLGSTGIRVKKSDWDQAAQRSKKKDEATQADNELLRTIENKLRSIHLMHEAQDLPLTPLTLKKFFKKKGSDNLSVYHFIDVYLEHSAQMRDARHIAVKTHETREDKLNIFKRFMAAEKLSDLLVEEVKGHVLERFKNWMLLRGNKLAYAQKCQQFVKTFLRWLWKNGHIENDPSAAYMINMPKTPLLEHLSKQELETLASTSFSPKLQHTVDCYVFACYTGLAYVDMTLLSQASIETVEGREYLKGNRQKTGTSYYVPLSKVAKQIIAKYGGVDKLPLKSNKEVNYMIKIAMEKIGVNRRIWFHTGRKTFTHLMQNEHLMSDETTAAMLGHKSTKELKLYRNITKERVLKEAANLNF